MRYRFRSAWFWSCFPPSLNLNYVGLAYPALQQQQWKALADTTERLVQFAPNSPEFRFLNSVASFNLGNGEQAETSIERGLRLDQKHQIP